MLELPALFGLRDIERVRAQSTYGNHSYGMLLYSLAYAKCVVPTAAELESGQDEPRRIVEIGFHLGYSALMFLAAIAESRRPGKVTSVDIAVQPEGLHNISLQNGFAAWHEAIEGDAPSVAHRAAAAAGGPIDLLLIDGDHSYEGCRRDYECYAPLLASDGLLLFHDNNIPGVRQALEEVQGWRLTNLGGWSGLTAGTVDAYCPAANVTMRPQVVTSSHPQIRESPLMRAGGYVVLPDLISRQKIASLVEEALSLRPKGFRAVSAGPDDFEGRGGNPARAYRLVNAGQTQWDVYGSPDMALVLSNLMNTPVVATGSGTYSYYEEPGDFLALHRDVLTCDMAVITCLADDAPEQDGGSLRLHPGYCDQPLAAIRAGNGADSVLVHLRQGETIVMLGGIVPHELLPVCSGQNRIVSVMCYQVLLY
jgi:hypothetical protein